ncbi:MAG: UDP-N-acetylglucosamine 1-carboxyvinyltransferase [Verrucomicrobiales bacterium]
MDKILVYGGHGKLRGTVKISGSKNSALPILAATLLTKETCVIHRVPDLSDIHYMLQILTCLGCEVERASGTVTVRAEKIQTLAPYEVVRRMRASVCVMGPLLGREKEATVSLPGGCVIGDRPIDLHLRGFEALGAMVRVESGYVKVFASQPRGAVVDMKGKFGSTVLGTDNVMMAAVLADGVTVIEGAAQEPEVVDLANFLIKMGAKIEGAGTARIIIEGVPELHGTEHAVIPDRIEAGTFMIAAAMAGDKVRVQRVVPEHLQSITDAIRAGGYVVETDQDSVTISRNGQVYPVDLTTEPYPGFPTDMQAQMCALMSITHGRSRITDQVFPQRFMHVAELKRMGATIDLEQSTAHISGVDNLSAAPVMASDLRASAALVLAGLQAVGITEVNRVYHIDRGYEHIDEKLIDLGAHIERVKA